MSRGARPEKLMSEHDEEFVRLLEEFRNGSDDAAERLIQEYGRYILRAVRRRLSIGLRTQFDSQDFVQAVYASLVRNRDALKKIESPDKLARFLVGMAEHKVIDQCRRYLGAEKRDLTRQCSLDGSAEFARLTLVNSEPAPDEQIAVDDQVEQLLRGEPSHYRKMLELRTAGATQGEIAEKLNISQRTARRVLRKIAQRYRDRDQDGWQSE